MAKQADRKIHESSRRTLVRLAFLTLSVVPLVLCLVWSLLQYAGLNHARQVAAWEELLSQRLGVNVSIEQVELLSPTRTRLHGLQIRDPENKVVYAIARVIDHQWSNQLQRMKVYDLAVEGSRMAGAYSLLKDLLIRPSEQDCELELQFANVVIQGGIKPQSFPSADLHVFPTTSETSLELDIVSQQYRDKKPIRISLTRFHGEGNQRTELNFVSNETPLPCSLVRWFQPGISSFGDGAELLGSATLGFDSNGWRLLINRAQKPVQELTIQKIDFATLSWNAPEIVTGQGRVVLKDLDASLAGLTRVWGLMEIGHGEIQRQFLQVASRQLGVILPEHLQAAPAGTEGFGRIGLWFHVDLSGSPTVNLAGDLEIAVEGGEVRKGALLEDRAGNPMAAKFDWDNPVRLPSLLQAFKPSGGGLVDGVEFASSSVPKRGYAPVTSVLESWLKPKQEILHSQRNARGSRTTMH
ncbi:MAG: hypothetical protein VXZ82_18730 [Planctomycetota bacterium]|nr:hypothetical protein [Planctomycetota bacterium]